MLRVLRLDIQAFIVDRQARNYSARTVGAVSFLVETRREPATAPQRPNVIMSTPPPNPLPEFRRGGFRSPPPCVAGMGAGGWGPL